MRMKDIVISEATNEGDDLRKLVAHYQNSKLSDGKLKDAIGDDLEQLEYSPEDVERLVPEVFKKVRGS